jgi:ABC-type transporter Mla maintaining outer membrane lipid asymmetry ATPase subunit MlaF
VQTGEIMGCRQRHQQVGADARILGLRTPPGRGIDRVLGVDAWNSPPSRAPEIERNSGVLYQNGALFSS